MALLIDISHWDSKFEPSVVQGVLDGAIIKGTDGTVPDSRAMQHIDACRKANFPFGMYLYYRTGTGALQQLRTLYDLYYREGARFFALDFEKTFNALTIERAKECANALLIVQREHPDCAFVLYTGKYLFLEFFAPFWNDVYRDAIQIWHAQYPLAYWSEAYYKRVSDGDFSGMLPPANTRVVLWQFTAHAPAHRFGVSGKNAVDLNVVVDPGIMQYFRGKQEGPQPENNADDEYSKIKEELAAILEAMNSLSSKLRDVYDRLEKGRTV